jgi:hypothetical protein
MQDTAPPASGNDSFVARFRVIKYVIPGAGHRPYGLLRCSEQSPIVEW